MNVVTQGSIILERLYLERDMETGHFPEAHSSPSLACAVGRSSCQHNKVERWGPTLQGCPLTFPVSVPTSTNRCTDTCAYSRTSRDTHVTHSPSSQKKKKKRQTSKTGGILHLLGILSPTDKCKFKGKHANVCIKCKELHWLELTYMVILSHKEDREIKFFSL